MKLTKAKLIKSVKPKIESMGFTEFKDTIEASQGLFVKVLANGLYLVLGLTISRFYDSMFTGNYYLSKTTRIGSTWGDIPKESYERVSAFLTKDERGKFLDEKYKEGIDGWWDGSNQDNIDNFLKVIELTQQRFIIQPELLKKIEESKEILELSLLAEMVKQIVSSNQVSAKFDFQPEKEIDGIPFIWFKAAEIALKNRGGILNKNTVKFLAADAWRQSKLNKNGITI